MWPSPFVLPSIQGWVAAFGAAAAYPPSAALRETIMDIRLPCMRERASTCVSPSPLRQGPAVVVLGACCSFSARAEPASGFEHSLQ